MCLSCNVVNRFFVFLTEARQPWHSSILHTCLQRATAKRQIHASSVLLQRAQGTQVFSPHYSTAYLVHIHRQHISFVTILSQVVTVQTNALLLVCTGSLQGVQILCAPAASCFVFHRSTVLTRQRTGPCSSPTATCTRWIPWSSTSPWRASPSTTYGAFCCNTICLPSFTTLTGW